jgi:NADH-quinone oxidoreductase subunit M
LSAVFLGQLKPEHKDLKEAPVLMIIPMIVLSLISLLYGVVPNLLLSFVEKINVSLGLMSAGETMLDGQIIRGVNGDLDPTLIFAIFGLGFVFALIIFLLGPKAKKVGLMDTYTAGEFIHSEHLYHYSYRFYAPVVRIYENHPKITNVYLSLVKHIYELGEFIKASVFTIVPSRGVMLLTVTLILLMWGDRL